MGSSSAQKAKTGLQNSPSKGESVSKRNHRWEGATPATMRICFSKNSLLKSAKLKETMKSSALAKAQQQLLDQQERDYILSQVTAAKEELRAKRKKQLKKDTASKLKLLVDEGKSEQEYEQSEEFQQELKLKVRELLTEQEWWQRKMAMRISEEEDRLKKDEEEQKEIWKRKREHEEQWEGTRETASMYSLFLFCSSGFKLEGFYEVREKV
ncbi:stress response protein NST1-like isoform X3 [Durio zibethinus]|uniref:Stress response protein NST1-like isoform X3 n=1 Tax=Durio zibethinus TaxID=66656 RepID=A0A6P5ZUB6_DURZI|nr:stress response protein NST1-like isoform X3 [Durio zibethinus]